MPFSYCPLRETLKVSASLDLRDPARSRSSQMNTTEPPSLPSPVTRLERQISTSVEGSDGGFASFWKKVDRSGSGCWPWVEAVDRHGYGRFRLGNKRTGAHRMAWMLSKGDIPDGMMVCHACDNRRCCNPAHLWIGTHDANMADRDAKSRCATLDDHGRAKVSKQLAQEARALYATGKFSQKALGRMFGIKTSAMGSLLRGETWKGV